MDRTLYIWLGLLGLMAVTFLARSSLILWAKDIHLPARLQRALRFAPMAAIVAIIVPSVLTQQGSFDPSLLNPKTLSVLAAFLAWWLSRQMAVCMLVGVAVYVGARFSLGF
jgi:branched-subunit amino acid transport protein